jgi:hypothetical protein
MTQYMIDRKTAVDLFYELLDIDNPMRLLWLYGEGKMGKSCLMGHFHREARHNGFLCAHLKLESGYTNVSSVLDALKQQLGGAKEFPSHQKAIQKHASQQVKIDVNDVDIKDHSKLFVQTAKDDHSVRMRRSELTDAFLDDMVRLQRKKQKLFLLDAMDKAETEIGRWVQDHLLVGLHRLDNTVVVLAGRDKPILQPPWEFDCHSHKLEPVTVGDYWDYCQQIELQLAMETVETLHTIFFGSPGAFFESVQTLKQQGKAA